MGPRNILVFKDWPVGEGRLGRVCNHVLIDDLNNALLAGYLVGNADNVVLGHRGGSVRCGELLGSRGAGASRVAAATALDADAATGGGEAVAVSLKVNKRSVEGFNDIASSRAKDILIRNLVGSQGSGHFGGEMLESPDIAGVRYNARRAEIGRGDVHLAAGNQVLRIASLNLAMTASLAAVAASWRHV